MNGAESGTATRPASRKLPPGQHPGFAKLPAKVGVYRCKLYYQATKAEPSHADYKGILELTNSRAWVLVWVHSDGSLGLRLEKIEKKKKGAAQ